MTVWRARNAILVARMTPSATVAVQQAVVEILKDVSRRPIEPVLESDLIADLGFDSLQVLEVIGQLEDRFDISIPTDDFAGTRTVAHVIDRVVALIEGRPAA